MKNISNLLEDINIKYMNCIRPDEDDYYFDEKENTLYISPILNDYKTVVLYIESVSDTIQDPQGLESLIIKKLNG